ncbi:Clavaminate synthase-like protein [Peniophora sp. CONT]|nr:Clavaminate synthase-like protein [Peniophora sp. CONT]
MNTPLDSTAHKAALRWLSAEYHDMNGSHFVTLDSPPSPVEFARLVQISRPVLINDHTVPGTDQWSNDYLSRTMGDRLVSVAVTPDGYADAVTRGPDGRLYFVEPHVQPMTIRSLLTRLADNTDLSAQREALYLQSQNGNLYSSAYFSQSEEELPELAPLRSDIPAEVPWCSEALGRQPDAVNLWIGGDQSVTSIHSDPYENVYHVVRGCKVFTLLPPTEAWCLRERVYPHAKYTRESEGDPLVLTPTMPENGEKATATVRWSSIRRPDREDELPLEAHPITVTVHTGQTLYLPAGWWHHVKQVGGTTIAFNWWYDVEGQGMNWVWLNFLRGPENAVPSGNEENEGVNEAN